MLQPRKRKTPPIDQGTSAAPPDDLEPRNEDDEDDPLPTIASLMVDEGLTVVDQPVVSTDAPKSGRVARARSESVRQASEAGSPPAKKSQTAARSSSTAKSGTASNPYSTRTAAQRRAERETRRSAITPRTGASQPRKAKPRPTSGTSGASGASPALVRELLLNPTRTVSEEELRQAYGYVLADVRNMALLAFALVIVLVVLAQVLPR